jgi:cytidylate kinase
MRTVVRRPPMCAATLAVHSSVLAHTISRIMRGLVIAIDGPTAAGKSTAGRALAASLGYLYIDTGAMYRAVGWKAIDEGIGLEDAPRLADLAARMRIELGGDPHHVSVAVDGRNVTDALRTPAVDAAASRVSAVAGVRAALVEQQRSMGRDGGVVLDGRDIGTHVFPEAAVKFFLVAESAVRAERRHEENLTRGRTEDLAETRAAIDERDRRDRGRDVAPLEPASDAILLDTSGLSREEVVSRMLEIVRSRL